MTERRKIRWLIAHYPEYLFVRTAEAFGTELEKMCPGQFEIEILNMYEYVNKYDKLHDLLTVPPIIPGLSQGKKEMPPEIKDQYKQVATWKEGSKRWTTLFDALSEGEFEMSQTQISIIGAYLHKNFSAIDLPYLFNDHDHVSRVLDGDIGDMLGNQLAEKTDIRGLAFTYSGGYRVIGSNHKITNLTELAQSKLLTHTIHSTKLFEEIGANLLHKFVANDQEIADTTSSPNTAMETTYLRFNGSHVYKTEHSMFTTSILTGNKFWASLTEDQQTAFQVAAKKTAKLEREWSIADAKKYEDEAVSKGIEIVDISAEDTANLRKASSAVYDTLAERSIDPILVQAIIDAGNNQIH